MINLLGEYPCKLDTKCRVALPAALLKQLPNDARERFVINRGVERHLTLYPGPVWEQVSSEINQLNLFISDNRRFHRRFYGGATPLVLDNQHRLLLPKQLLEYAGITDHIVLFAHGNQIEVWAESSYQQEIDMEPDDYAALAERVMGQRGPERSD